MDDTPTRGRPRSETARRAVLDAALRLCQEGGYQALTMKAIAETAGVGRQTVYRWWPAKQDVLLDALGDIRLREARQLDPDTGDTLLDLRTLLAATFAQADRLTGKALTGLMADAQHDPRLSHRVQGTVIGPCRHALLDMLARGVARGELSARIPLPLAVDFALGAMWYRLIGHHAPVDAALAEQITGPSPRCCARTGRAPLSGAHTVHDGTTSTMSPATDSTSASSSARSDSRATAPSRYLPCSVPESHSDSTRNSPPAASPNTPAQHPGRPGHRRVPHPLLHEREVLHTVRPHLAQAPPAAGPRR